MRILHTSDWHAGKVLFQRDRMPELNFALEQILELIEAESVDLVIVAGDLYDTFHPPARAIQGLNHFFLQLFKRDIPAVVIAGNHDSAHLWKSMQNLLSLASIHVYDRIGLENMTLSLELGGEPLHITNLPYPSERQLVSIADGLSDMGQQRASYAHKVEQLLDILAEEIPQEGYHLLNAHLMMNGAEPGHSERALSIAETFAVQPQHIPDLFDYVALGHIHKRQSVKGASVPTWYCGTPYQIDFGEAKSEKGVHLIDLNPGQKARVRFHKLKLLHPLQSLDIHEDQLEEVYDRWQEQPDLLKLRVKVDAPRKGLADEIRSVLKDQLLKVEIHTPEKRVLVPRHADLELDKPLAVYRTYCEVNNLPLDADLEQSFLQLLAEIET